MGTLGIITQLTLKVRPMPEASAIAWVPLTGPNRAAEQLDRLNTSDTRPIAIELLNAAAARGSARRWDFRPSTGPGRRLRGQRRLGPLAARPAEERAGPADLIVVEGEQTAPLWDGADRVPGRGAGPFSFVANLRPSSVVASSSELDPDGGRSRPTPATGSSEPMPWASGPWRRRPARSSTFRDRAVGDGGNLILARCPTEWKERLRVWGQPRADWAIAERVRAALDPHGAMNPGRFVVG